MVDSLHKCIPLFEIAFAGLIEIGLYESLPDIFHSLLVGVHQVAGIEAIVAKIIQHDLVCRKVVASLFAAEPLDGKPQRRLRECILAQSIADMPHRTHGKNQPQTGISLLKPGYQLEPGHGDLFDLDAAAGEEGGGLLVAVGDYHIPPIQKVTIGSAEGDADGLALLRYIAYTFRYPAKPVDTLFDPGRRVGGVSHPGVDHPSPFEECRGKCLGRMFAQQHHPKPLRNR